MVIYGNRKITLIKLSSCCLKLHHYNSISWNLSNQAWEFFWGLNCYGLSPIWKSSKCSKKCGALQNCCLLVKAIAFVMLSLLSPLLGLHYLPNEMGNSRKYPYYTKDGFHILTSPCPQNLQNGLSPCAWNSIIILIITVNSSPPPFWWLNPFFCQTLFNSWQCL